MTTSRQNGHLAEAMALLFQNQVAFLAQLTEDHKRLSKNERAVAEIKRDLEQIKAILLRHEQILSDLPEAIRRHEQILSDLPEAIRQKIGFKPK
jgi:hypothetical protein